MNILPKKRWHVRTKDNIARVRRDEAKAAEEEKEKQRRALLAEQETRTALLRKRARQRQGIVEGEEEPGCIDSTAETHYEVVFRNGACVSVPVTEEKNLVQFSASGHVNFFSSLEEGKQIEGVANKEHEEDKKNEQEEYEKKIGLLTYLGQGSRESTGDVPWYEKPSLVTQLQKQKQDEVNHKIEKAKEKFDPLRVIEHYIGKSQPVKKEEYLVSKFVPAAGDLRFPSTSLSSTSASVGNVEENAKQSKERKRKHKKEKKPKKDKKLKKAKKKRSRKDSSDECEKEKRRSRRKSRISSSCSSSSDSSDSSDSETEKRKRLQILRAKRLEREKIERQKANKLLAKVNGISAVEDNPSEGEKSETDEQRTNARPIKQKYYSQYNPDLAKQNQPLDSNTKYWLQ